MEREYRYLVAKYKDILKYLTETEQRELLDLVGKIEAGREKDGRRRLECVCVEDDWPEYDEVWNMIAARVDGVPRYKAGMQQFKDYGRGDEPLHST